MATQPSNEKTSEPLKYQTWVLKVSIHCEGCKKKVHKILHNIDGVFTVSIDAQQHKVSVTGNVEAEKLIKKLAKAGKHAEIIPENVGESENKNGKSKKKKKNKNNPDNTEKTSGDEDDKNPEEKKDEKSLENANKTDAEEEKPTPNDNGEKKKKKKKKNKNGNNVEGANAGDAPANTEFITPSETVDPPIGMMHLGPPFGQVYSFPASYYPAQTFGLSYNTSHPSGTSSYYASPTYGYNKSYIVYNNYNHDDVYVENDDQGGCSIM